MSHLDDKIVYFGVINLNINGKTIGSVDIWRSVITKEMFCEEKRLGILDIVDYIGMSKLSSDQKWAIAVNNKRAPQDSWKLVKIINNGNLSIQDSDGETMNTVKVVNYNIVDEDWWSLLVEKNINRTVDISNR
ncbi:MAG: hypothetical protein WB511_10295 [Nitrososphaeraceae archaeon]